MSLRSLKFWFGMRRYFWHEYFLSGEYELIKINKYISTSGISLDIGACTGIYTYHLSRKAYHVYAFEPNKAMFERLCALGLKNVSVINVAISSEAGVAKLRFPKTASGMEDIGMASLEPFAVDDKFLSRSVDVKLCRIDDYCFNEVSFIKIDVEGHEEKVLDGADETIKRDRPVLLIEIEERHNPGALARIQARLLKLNYSGYFFENGRRRSLHDFDVSRHQVITTALGNARHRRRAASSYINNFLFLPNFDLSPSIDLKRSKLCFPQYRL